MINFEEIAKELRNNARDHRDLEKAVLREQIKAQDSEYKRYIDGVEDAIKAIKIAYAKEKQAEFDIGGVVRPTVNTDSIAAAMEMMNG